MLKHPIIFLLHLSFFFILCGAFLTFMTGKSGTVHLRSGKPENTFTDKKSNTQQTLPFEITLSDFQIVCYSGTQTPFNYISNVKITDHEKKVTGQISMNKILLYKSYRFYQSRYDADRKGVLLMVKTDRYGLPVVSCGVILLLISMIGFFFSKKTQFRALLKHPALKKGIMAICFGIMMNNAMTQERVLPQKIAQELGEIQMLYHGRIAPVQTFAKDFTLKLYGKSTYNSLSSEQILSGWLLYPEKWEHERINEMGNEKIEIIFMLQKGMLLTVFPKRTGEELHWFCPEDDLPNDFPDDEKLLIKGYFELLRYYAAENDLKSIETAIEKLKLFQKKNAGNVLLTPAKIKTERLYNTLNIVKPIALVNLLLGIFAMFYFFRTMNNAYKKRGYFSKMTVIVLNIFLIFSWTGIATLLCLRGYISGRIPMGNGFETLQFLSFCIMLLAFLFQRKFFLFLPFGFIFSGLVLFVSGMSINSAQITHLQPVLVSSWLGIHVSLIMIAYSLFCFVTLNALAAFLHIIVVKKSKSSSEIHLRIIQMALISKILLYPALFLLIGGIVAGSVWAEVSWGNYWSWDPKEIWALITALVYAVSIHPAILSPERPLFFHGYTLFAFLSVLMTYFGVNYLFGGMHSYGG
jgi:ABC-type transport system involved in cytochrome c biogenesis permease subunit